MERSWVQVLVVGWLLVLGVVVQVACGSLSGPGVNPQLVATEAEPPGDPFQVSASVEFIRVRGSIETDNNCQRIVAEVDRFSEGSVLELAIEAESLSGCPSDRVTLWNYSVAVVDIPGGTYEVTVRHRFVDSERPTEEVFAGTVMVESR